MHRTEFHVMIIIAVKVTIPIVLVCKKQTINLGNDKTSTMNLLDRHISVRYTLLHA